jgi:two-component system response regulator WspF
MKIAIVNDTIMAIEALRRVLISVPEYRIIWVARDGAEAVRKAQENPPDLMLMDLIMPVMDGVEATRQIMKNSPCAILIVTSSVRKNSSRVFDALGAGALDVVNTPVLGHTGKGQLGQTLLHKIRMIGRLSGKLGYSFQPQSSVESSGIGTRNEVFSSQMPSLLAIGSSTGGPKALATILGKLPADFKAAIVIVQHVDVQFSSGLVQWLNQQTPLTVELAKEGSNIQLGKVLVAGSNDHLYLKSNLTLGYTKDPEDYPYRPSVDVFFKSVAQYWKRKGVAVLLTGMGRDGAEGLNVLKLKGWHTIAQDQASCVVYGMPKAAAELNAAVEVLSLEAIAPSLLKSFR